MKQKPILATSIAYLLGILFFCQIPHFIFSQALQVTGANTPAFSPQSLIENVFLGAGVEVKSITYVGDASAVGYFSGGQTAVGINRGIILTTGRAASQGTTFGADADGSDFANTSNSGGSVEPDLDNLVSVGLNDVAAYTITFVPTSDTLRFRYCFASEEYPEFACSPYNDVFGFFIQGPGYPIPKNIALIPNTNLPVTINNLHPFNVSYPFCFATNAVYYINNNNSNKQPAYDGLTKVFTAMAIVTPCEEYTIKLAIADASDSAYDSGVFLEAKSFGTASIRTEIATVSLDGTVTEGCTKGTVTFSLPDPALQNFPLDYNIWGSATNGVDYQAIALNQVIPAGSNKLVLDIVALEDNLADNNEFIAIDIKKDPCNRDTFYLFIRENTLVPPLLRLDTSLCSGNLLLLDGTLPIPLPPPYVFTSTQKVTVAPLNTAVVSAINVVGVVPIALDSGIIRSVCINVNHAWVDDLDIFLISPGGEFIELTTDNGGNADNYTKTCFTPTATTPIIFPGPIFAPPSSAPFTGNFKPEGLWSDLSGSPTNGQWRLQLVDDQNGFVGELQDWTITFEPSYKVTYQWSPALGLSCVTCPNPNATPTQTTQYQLVATDNYGCTVSDDVKLTINPTLSAPVIDCGNATASSVTFTWPSLVGSAGYEINVGGTGWISVASDTFYTVGGLSPSTAINAEIRGINQFALCGASIATGTCVNCSPPNVSVAASPVKCFNGTDGAVTFTPDNVNPPYTYRVGVVSNITGTFNNLLAGNYAGVVTDGLGCDTTINFVIGTPPALQSNVSALQNVSCFGSNDGGLTVAVTGGTSGYSYLWSTGAQTTTSVSGLTAGTYAVSVTDANGCSITSPGSITQPTLLSAATTALPAKCNGTATGTVTGTGTGGTTPYTYIWNTAQTSASVANVLPGTYLLTITDAKGCKDTSTVVVSQPPLLLAAITAAPATCSDKSDGKATAIPTGGTAPFSYRWSTVPLQTTISATGLLPGVYTVTITDANLCTATANTTIGAPLPLVLTISQTPTICNGGNDGTATVTPLGGNGGYLYSWTGSSMATSTITGLVFGNYIVTVTDSKGCTSSSNVNVTQPNALLANSTSTATKCFDSEDGSAKVNVIGGILPFNYTWSSGQNTPDIVDQPAGFYTVTVTDANQCTVTATSTIGQPPQIVAAFERENVRCFYGTSGSIKTQITGGTGNYSIVWFGPEMFISTALNNDSLFAGEYIATITDAIGCTAVYSVTLNQPLAPLQLTIPYISDTVCYNAATGTAKVFPQGGTTPYSYLWDDPSAQTLQFPIDLPVRSYQVTVTDANGCTQTDSTYIYQKNPLFVYVTPYLPRCFEGSDGYASVDFVSYGADPYDPSLLSYVWSTTPSQTGRLAINLTHSTTYFLTATDDDGCTATQMIPMSNQEELVGFFTGVLNIDCNGANTGAAVINAKGGTTPYTYFWEPIVGNQTDAAVRDLRSGTYQVTITDARTCQTIADITLTEPPPITNILTPNTIPCFGDVAGQITAKPSGGTEPFSFYWENGQITDQLKQVQAGIYTLTLTDANGCTKVDSAEITQPPTPVGGVYVSKGVTCFGGSDGRVTITANGGTPPYQYALDNQPFNGSPLQFALPSGTYTPKVRDAKGCVIELPDVFIDQHPPIQIDLGPDISIELGQNTQLTADVMNAYEPYRLTWNAKDSLWLTCLTCPNPVVDSLFVQNTFEVFVVDAKGCTGEKTIDVNVLKPRKIYVPTGFTPNGDNTNDILLVHGQQSAQILDFRIFDRWGEMVFNSNNFIPNQVSAGWDGTFRGQMMLPGVYVWMLDVEYLDGFKETLHGQTTLIR